MFAGYRTSRRARRGVILIVVLGMLGLLALVGVTFATFSAQARISARNFSQSQNFPDSSEVMDFALSQLVDDTYNPVSAIRGHSLKRDMFGNDATFNGYLNGRPDTGYPLIFTAVQNAPMAYGGTVACTLGYFDTQQNQAFPIAYNDPAFYGYFDFTRWIVKVPLKVVPNGGNYVGAVSETFEVVADDYTGGSSASRVLYLTPHDSVTGITNFVSPYQAGAVTQSALIGLNTGVQVILDGRYLRAFNGPGMGAPVAFSWNSSTYTYPANVYGNFRINGGLINGAQGSAVPTLAPLGDPNAVGMDEDYDACDLDNWFLAIQSADGQVVIPSFHRPAVIRADPTNINSNDWNNFSSSSSPPAPPDSMARILRPRKYDGHSQLSFPDLLPDSNGRITYDIDNDGDGVTDSVWLDLGYPAKRDPTGQLFKPLFSFLVVGLNGRLPLNSAGNLQLRDDELGTATGTAFAPLSAHAGRLGYSPSEIDISYALQNAAGSTYSQNDNSGSSGSPNNVIPNTNFATNGVPVNLTQLRNILTGTRPQLSPYTAPSASTNGDANFVAVNNQPYYMPNNVYDNGDLPSSGVVQRFTPRVEGRWGEGDYVPNYLNAPAIAAAFAFNFSSQIAAGRSLYYGLTVEDDNYTQFDPSGKAVDSYDVAGGLFLPVERIRRYTTPLDVSGNGILARFNNGSGGPNAINAQLPPFGNGPDAFGRVGYYLYYRPTNSYPTRYLTVGGNNLASNAPPDQTTNPLHGFDGFYNPLVTKANFNNLTAMGASDGVGGGPNRLAFNEADEMRLYTPNEYDNAFDIGDLQWLYRSQDTDGASLTSRLSQLAPISFLNAQDGTRRRRLFALDAWDTTNFAWTPDNPQGAFPDNSRFASIANPNNTASSTYLPYTANASFANLNVTTTTISNASGYPFGYFSPLAPYGPTNGYAPANTAAAIANDPSPSWPARTPALAHRDRKINLNYPLPVSNEADEPVRQKWIGDTYRMLKSILPPLSIDTPAECAQLSQFVINIVDFRDPDSTMTHWVNPDVQVVPPTTGAGGTPPQLVWTSASVSGATALNQYGMEYLPVAINEVLAYSYLRKDYDTASSKAMGRPTNRFFVELVNTLTQSSTGPTSGAGKIDPTDAIASGNAASPLGLDMTNWDIVIAEDDPYGRPDPTTGQLLGTPNTANEVYGPVPLGPAGFIDFTKQAATPATVAQPIQIPAITAGTTVPFNPTTTSGSSTATSSATGTAPQDQVAWNPYFVIGNILPTIPTSGGTGQKCENNPPSILNYIPDQVMTLIDGSTATTYSLTETDLFDSYAASTSGNSRLTNSVQTATSPNNTLIDKANNQTLYPVPQLASNAKKFLWLYLRRPANPFALAGTSPMVVIDCMRFVYLEGGGTIAQANISQTDYQDGTGTPKKVTAGGNPLYSTQRIQPFRGGHAIGVLPAAGSDAITAYGYSEQTLSPTSATANPNNNYGVFGNQRMTQDISETLGVPNSITEPWDYFPFHDRDFSSVAELLLVPGCPPGLFTKQFVENNETNFTATPPITSPAPTTAAALTAGARSFPYLKDNFFYTAGSPTRLNGAGSVSWPQTGGPSGAGWHKMMEFFEVPSPALGATGTVADGSNYDWARQDVKPGLLNLNLIVDEEVWLGLMGNAGLRNTVTNLTATPMLNSNQVPNPSQISSGMGTLQENGVPVQFDSTGTPHALVPHVVTLTNLSTGAPYAFSSGTVSAYPMSNVGFLTSDPVMGTVDNRLKGAFADFLKLRHGGSGYVFAWGTGPVGSPLITAASPLPTTTPAAERPFRSLSFPDINYTVMRPAALPPSALTAPTATGLPLPAPPQPANFAWDPGVKNPYVTYPYMPATPPGDGYPNSHGTATPPSLPPRRLFEIPDATPGTGSNNATLLGDTNLNNLITLNTLTNIHFDLTAGATVYLGANAGDNRLHPYYRTEWLQKVMNLTTVRTHQYAVWITVAFFQVTKQGDPKLASDTSYWAGAVDWLGDELNVSTGRNIRYRSFFLLDRTRATGFNPASPGDFRNVVVYRQTIQ